MLDAIRCLQIDEQTERAQIWAIIMEPACAAASAPKGQVEVRARSFFSWRSQQTSASVEASRGGRWKN